MTGKFATRFPTERACLDCGAKIDAAGSVERQRRPKAGDVAVCFKCGHIMIYADREGALRRPTDAEMVELAGDPEIVALNNALAAFHKAHPEAAK